jgi:anti-anti-sigma factor
MELEMIERDDDITQVALIGRLDVTGLHDVDVEFHSHTAVRGKPTIVDVSAVDFIASLGMGMLISCAQSLQRSGASMVLLNPKGMVETTLKMAGIDQAIPVAHDIDDAIRILNEAGCSAD